MPEKRTLAAAKRDLKKGKSASTAAGEFVREEMDHIRAGKHGARSTKQAIAIGLSKARRAGIRLGVPKHASAATRKQAARETAKARSHAPTSRTRSRAMTKALRHEGHAAASRSALAKHAHAVASHKTAAARSASARKAARTRKHEGT